MRPKVADAPFRPAKKRPRDPKGGIGGGAQLSAQALSAIERATICHVMHCPRSAPCSHANTTCVPATWRATWPDANHVWVQRIPCPFEQAAARSPRRYSFGSLRQELHRTKPKKPLTLLIYSNYF
jgi:hypothetical protein